VNVAKELAQQLERAVPGTVHSLRLDTYFNHMRIDIVFNRDRLGGSGAGEGGAGDDAGAPAGAPEDAQRPGQQRPAAATATQPKRAPRPPPPPPTGQPQRPQQPSKAPEAPSALQQPAPAATPERPAAVQPGTCVQCVPHAEATAEPAQVGPPFCHIQPSRHGRRPRVPTTEVGRAVHVIREGVRAVAPVVDGGQSYDPARYYKGKIAIDGIASQDVEVPRGSIMHELLAEGPAAAGAEVADLIRRCEAMDADVESEMRKLLLPDEMMAPSDSSCSDSSSPAEPAPEISGFDLF